MDLEIAEAQRDIVAAFESGALTGGARPQRIDTHLSHVFLTPERAYKLKRAVKLPFVDFSTAQQRRAACDNELAVNRRTAPALYLDVRSVLRAGDGTLTLEGAGTPVDSVVVMKRFADEDLFDTMAREGRLSVDLIARTARIVAAFHGALTPERDPSRASAFPALIGELEETERLGAARHGRAPQGCDVFGHLRAQYETHRGLIDARRVAGKVRPGHGDLHLRNICLFDNTPTPFDGIEFESKIATCDVLYDFSFLLMDLLHRGLKAHANCALNEYFDAAREDENALALISFFMALRAAVRMAVLSQSGDFAQATAYRALALTLLEPRATRLVALGGLSGTGKSLAARSLAPLLPGSCGARILRSDVLRKDGGARRAPAPSAAYTAQARAAIYEILEARARDALSGASVIADATFQGEETRRAIAMLVPPPRFSGLWLSAPLATRIARIAQRRGDASDADARVAAQQSEPAALDGNWIAIDAAGSPDATLKQLCAALSLPCSAA